MREIVGKAYTELGRELYEAQQGLSKNGYGCFNEWCSYLGMSKRTVTNLIQRYETIRQNLPEQRNIIEDLPVSLSYEIAKPSAESTPAKSQAKSEVLAGDVDTGKAYKELLRIPQDSNNVYERVRTFIDTRSSNSWRISNNVYERVRAFNPCHVSRLLPSS